MQFVAQIFEMCVAVPLRALFHRGPSWLGGWQGKMEEDVCAELTTSPASFWIRHPEECTAMIEKQFQSFLVVFQVFVYGYLLCTVVHILLRACVFRWTVTMPIERLLLSAGSTARHISHMLPEHSSLHRRSEVARSLCKSRDFCISDTGLTQSGPPH